MQLANCNVKIFTNTGKEVRIIFIWKRKLKYQRDFLNILNCQFSIGQGKPNYFSCSF